MTIEKGAILEGTVTNITNFGAFIDLEGTIGLVHISEIAESYVKDIKEILKEGDKVKVKVLSVTPDKKISLSIKQAKDNYESQQNIGVRPQRVVRERNLRNEGTERSFQDFRPRQQEKGPQSFEDMLNKFSKDSEEKMAEFKRRAEGQGNKKRRS